MLNNPMYFYDDQILAELGTSKQVLTDDRHHLPMGSGFGDELYQQLNRMPIKDHLYSANEQEVDRKQYSSRDYARRSYERKQALLSRQNQKEVQPVNVNDHEEILDELVSP